MREFSYSKRKTRCGVAGCALLAQILILMALAGCDISGCKKGRGSQICAKVNGRKIYLEDVQKELQHLNLDITLVESEEQKKRIKKEVLLLIIDKELLMQEARLKKITVGEQDLEIYLKELTRDYPREKSPLETELKGAGRTRQREMVIDGLLIKRLIQKVIEPSIRITEEEIEAFFTTHKQEFERAEEFRARQIVVSSEKEAREILNFLKKGGDFAELARKRSLSPDREKGGELGFFKAGEMPSEFDQAISGLKKGEMSDVIKSDYGYHIFQLLEIHKPQELTLEDARPQIKEILLIRKRDRAFHDWLSQLRERAEITLYPKALITD